MSRNKLYTAKLLKEVEKKAKERPIQVYLEEYFETKYVARRVISMLKNQLFKGNFSSEKWQRKAETEERNQAILAMLMDGVWSSALGKIHDISKDDIIEYHSMKVHMMLMLNFEFEKEFRDYVISCAEEGFKIEREKNAKYLEGLNGADSKGTLRRLLSGWRFLHNNPVPPRLLIEEELFRQSDQEDSHSLQEKLEKWFETDLLLTRTRKPVDVTYRYSFAGEEITEYAYKKKKREVKTEIEKIQERRKFLYKVLHIDQEAEKYMKFIKAIGISYLLSGDRKRYPLIQVNSVSHGRALFDEYRSWYNNKYSEEISIFQREQERLSSKERKALQRLPQKLKKQERDLKILEHLTGGITNSAEIARLTGIPVRTVREVKKRLEGAVEDSNVDPTVDLVALKQVEKQEKERREKYEEMCKLEDQKEEERRVKHYHNRLRFLHDFVRATPKAMTKSINKSEEQITTDLIALGLSPHTTQNA